jgi:uncharacterized protein YggT (Ycf19 family)
MSLIRELLCTATLLLIVAIFGRIILSWFPLQPGGAGAKAFELLSKITDPILDPFAGSCRGPDCSTCHPSWSRWCCRSWCAG